jgi:hypothetical protein
MDIYINSEKINFELENEKNINDVTKAISEYASKSTPQQFISTIYIDDQEYSYTDETKLSGIKIDKVKKLEINTSDIYGITLLSISQIEKFLILLSDIIEGEKWDDNFIKIFESMDWMKEGIKQIVTIFGDEKNTLVHEKLSFIDSFGKLKDILLNLNASNYPLNNGLRENALELKNLILENLNSIKEQLKSNTKIIDKKSILENINKLIGEIDEIIPKLSNVPVLFQTGEDHESMEIIKSLANILEKSIGLFVIFKESFKLYLDKYTVKEVSFEEFFHVLTNHLKELMTAIENKDSVMIGDLLEYEFVPNIEEIKNIVLKIKQEAFEKAN